MQFSNTTSKDGLIQECEDLCGFSDAGISGDSYKLARFTSYLNQAYGVVLGWIFGVDKRWHFDDSNYTDFPFSTTTLVNNQRDYSLPDTLLNIRQIEVMDTAGKYNPLSLMSDEDYRRRYENQQEEAGMPSHYYLLGKSVVLYPKPSSTYATLSAGLRLTYDRYADYFLTTDTTQAPGFAQPYHCVLYKLASLNYLEKNDMDRYNRVFNEIYADRIGLKSQIEKHYMFRDANDKEQLKRKRKSYK